MFEIGKTDFIDKEKMTLRCFSFFALLKNFFFWIFDIHLLFLALNLCLIHFAWFKSYSNVITKYFHYNEIEALLLIHLLQRRTKQITSEHQNQMWQKLNKNSIKVDLVHTYFHFLYQYKQILINLIIKYKFQSIVLRSNFFS